MTRKINIVHVGSSGIPFGKSASVNRCLAIYTLLPRNRYNLLALNNKVSDYQSIKDKKVYSDIDYQYTPLNIKRSNYFIKRRIDKFMNGLNEFLILIRLGLIKKIDIMFYYPNGSFVDLLMYRFISKMFGFPIILHYVEYRSEFENVESYWKKINYNYFDKYFESLVDGAIPISEMLIKNIRNRKNDLPILKIPPIVDFNKFKKKEQVNSVDYFLYVGSASYDSALEMVLNAFELVEDKKYFLYMILKGNLKKVSTKIERNKKRELIKVFTNLEYQDLIRYNINARALLIPLSDRIQDKARFPQKISEYLASKNPIISSNIGEVEYYFSDKLNALIAEPDNVTSFSNKMSWVIENPNKSINIGEAGYKLGLEFFDSNGYSEAIDKFMINFN